MDAMTPVRVLLVDDDPLVRVGLAMMLKESADVLVVGEASDGREALQVIGETPVDVVLMDIRMPRLDGLSATELIRAAPRAPEVVVLTTFDADAHVHRALSAGASGFLLKDTPPPEILEAIRRVSAGEPVLSPSVLRALIERTFAGETVRRAAQSARARARLSVLNPREHEVARALARGLTNAGIAAELHMAVPTVKTHVSSAMTRLGLTNRVQLALLVQEGELDADTA